MSDALLSALHGVLAIFGLASVDPTVTGALALTVALVAASIVLAAVAQTSHAAAGGSSPPHPRRAIDVSTPLAQSDPDAPGHPRPRAPQHVASAA